MFRIHDICVVEDVQSVANTMQGLQKAENGDGSVIISENLRFLTDTEKTYYPTPEQCALAHEIVDTYDDNEKKGITETYVQGKLICAAVYKEAKELLEVEKQNH